MMLYKKSNIEMKCKVSDMLNVLPSEMQAIRDREEVMLENENLKKKKKRSNSIEHKVNEEGMLMKRLKSKAK